MTVIQNRGLGGTNFPLPSLRFPQVGKCGGVARVAFKYMQNMHTHVDPSN